MRLLYYGEDGELSVTADLVREDATPYYAILSHTWGADDEEVTFDDLTKNAGKNKHGYRKIQLCGEQAQRDGLQYFWVDTCCINKANKAEHSLAIRSMFRWYRNAARCYVYLPDVFVSPLGDEGQARPPPWDSEFRQCKWFTRGWTLQELLAPGVVEFYSRDWHRLGDRASLKSQIHEVTTVPYDVLEGAPLSQSSVDERFRWRQNRHTKLKEDAAYCLSGIFDVDMAPVYGEGTEEAFRRLHDKIRSQEESVRKREECLRDLRPTDPRNDKKRIEDTKGGLLEGSYRWVLDNSSFQQWHNNPHSQLLWIKGDPGKGKTMLLCGIINELQKTVAGTASVSYFFCQATDSRINSAAAVLRGLLYLLVSEQPALIAHVRKRYDQAGKSMFEDANAWVALTEIFADVLQDPSLDITYLLVDALDECVTDLPKLLHFVAKQSSASSRVKWIVSSRNWPSIEEQLGQAGHKVRLSLELNAESVSAAVSVFIQHKVSQLAQHKKYDMQTQGAVFEHLTSNANDTFLWVALVCQDLEKTAKRNVLKKLNSFPPGLDALYERMMQQIGASDDAELCRRVLASIALVYRPLTLAELVSLSELLEDVADEAEAREIVGLCGSFLTLRADTVYFVHQSAQDFLLVKASGDIFPDGIEAAHGVLFSRSLAILSRTLQRDMYGLEAPGISINDIAPPTPDPLAASRYPCIYWIDHLCDSKPKSRANEVKDVQDMSVVEGLSLCKSIAKGVVSMTRLCSLSQEVQGGEELTKLLQDARRFIMYHKGPIESYPLQLYASALLFSPTESAIRKQFQHEEPEGVTVQPAMSSGWSACLLTLEGHSSGVSSVAFSHDSTMLASASEDKTVKLWNASSGECLQTFTGHRGTVTSVAFSHDSTKLASASYDNTVRLWNASSGACLQTFTGHSSSVRSVAFSHDSSKLASASEDKTVKLWNASSGACLQTLNIGTNLHSLSFDSTDSCLCTEIGTFVIAIPETLGRAAAAEPEPQPPLYLGTNLSSDNTWIKHASKHMLWIPSEYRPLCSSVRGTTVAIGVGSGWVWTCSIDV
ncbi:WD40 repeat-like protein [Macroventuria anomochaeta]|uniref:WD40 repeat-like protein n=1 Tax=Macroventuria anomochaeta TaxID=301207 RepID=A0ACB6SJW3_9PLEO|nr:WD40 repeat-like protein [Macroventuria anomochaeta]KAF2633809.1 WD40 repeat-like protein [Macroventuria anomochaeta]